MIKYKLKDKKGQWIGENEYHREVKLYSSPNKSKILSEHFALGMTIIEPHHRHEEHEHDANREIMIIYEGKGILTSKGEEIVVEKGDILSFDFNEPHGFVNNEDSTLKILWIYHPPGYAETKFYVPDED